MDKREKRIYNINLIPGYEKISAKNKIRLNVLIDANNLTIKLKEEKIGNEEINIIILNFYEEDAIVESFTLVGENNTFTNEDVNMMFNNM